MTVLHSKRWPFQATTEPSETRRDFEAISAWCRANIGPYNESWYVWYEYPRDNPRSVWGFQRSDDAVLFALRWS